MSQFYEQELPDISRDSTLNSERDADHHGKYKGVADTRRRDLKKDPVQKAKEKLWESIVKETENDDGDESSDDEHQI